MYDWVAAMRHVRRAVEAEEAVSLEEEPDWIAMVTELMKPQEQMMERRKQEVQMVKNKSQI